MSYKEEHTPHKECNFSFKNKGEREGERKGKSWNNFNFGPAWHNILGEIQDFGVVLKEEDPSETYDYYEGLNNQHAYSDRYNTALETMGCHGFHITKKP